MMYLELAGGGEGLVLMMKGAAALIPVLRFVFLDDGITEVDLPSHLSGQQVQNSCYFKS